jgi:DNA-binding winged helix-turn-helix (wHTH) protein
VPPLSALNLSPSLQRDDVPPLRSFPPFQIDLREERLWKDGEELSLRRKPFAILRYLAEHPRRLVTHEELVEAVWGKVVMSDSVLRTHIRALRQVLGEGIVETVVGRGYRFRIDVLELDAASGSRVKRTDAPLEDVRPPSLVGRASEIATLRVALESARDGRRQLVFVAGEAGVGKTTLVDTFLEQVASEGLAWIARGSCVEQYGSGEAYLPVVAAIGHLCGSAGGERIVQVLSRHAPTWLAQLPALVTPDRAEELRRRVAWSTQAGMLRESAAALAALSNDENPVILALDDLHWSDPSTVELLAFLGRRREADRLLVIGTYRPGELAKAHPLTRVLGELIAHKQAASLSLGTFSEDAVADYIDARFAGHGFPRDLATTLHRTTGGNPLFVVTLLDDLEGRQMVRVVDGRWDLASSVEDVASRRPESIRRLLDVQIDRLGVMEQRIVEAASVAGITFAVGAVAHALDMPVDAVDSCCESLANEHRFLRYVGTETWPDGTIQSRYGFAHALYQHAALARTSSVRLWHRRIAERLEAAYADQTDAIAPELAEHFDEGHAFSKAAQYRALAGERAVRRHGSYEARGHFERAGTLIAQLPEGRDRDELELRVLHGLGPCLLRTAAWDAPGLVETFTRAVELASSLARDEELCAALLGLQHWRMVKGELRRVGEHAGELARIASRLASPALGEAGARIASAASFYRGRVSEAERGLALMCATQNVQSVEPTVAFSARGALSLLAWLAGRPDEALKLGREAVSKAERIGDPWSLAVALLDVGRTCLWRRDAAGVLEFAQRTLAIAAESHFPRLGAIARLLACWASSGLDPGASAAHLDDLLTERWGGQRTGKTMDTLVFVDVCVRAGRHGVALEKITHAMDHMEQIDERFVEPELHRVRGELLKATDPREAERSFTKALEVARHQASRSFELRAATSLHRFHTGVRREKALEEVRRVFGTFSEGLETGDLLDAKRVLTESAAR